MTNRQLQGAYFWLLFVLLLVAFILEPIARRLGW